MISTTISAVTGYTNAKEAAQNFADGKYSSFAANATFATILGLTSATAATVGLLHLITYAGHDKTFGFETSGSEIADNFVNQHISPHYQGSKLEPIVDKAIEVATDLSIFAKNTIEPHIPKMLHILESGKNITLIAVEASVNWAKSFNLTRLGM